MSTPVHKHDGTDNLYDLAGVGKMISWGATIPANGGAGFAPGGLYLTTTTKKLYVNEGTVTSATWVVAGTQS